VVLENANIRQKDVHRENRRQSKKEKSNTRVAKVWKNADHPHVHRESIIIQRNSDRVSR
jgi:hypothetical protein